MRLAALLLLCCVLSGCAAHRHRGPDMNRIYMQHFTNGNAMRDHRFSS